jgi:hypothetical protein
MPQSCLRGWEATMKAIYASWKKLLRNIKSVTITNRRSAMLNICFASGILEDG